MINPSKSVIPRDTRSIYLTHTKHRGQESSQVSCVINPSKGVIPRDTRSIYLTHTKHRGQESSQVSCVINPSKSVIPRDTRSIYLTHTKHRGHAPSQDTDLNDSSHHDVDRVKYTTWYRSALSDSSCSSNQEQSVKH